MARTRRVEPSNSLVASAAHYGKSGAKSFHAISRKDDAWQNEAWNMYHVVGEFRYSCDWVGSMLSKAILHATVEKDGKVEPVTTGTAAEAVDSLFGDSDGRAEMLRLIGIHMTVAGECFIIAYPHPDNDSFRAPRDVWEVVASTKLKRLGTSDDAKWQVNGETLDVDPEDVLVTRIWRPNPLDPKLAISPARAVLNILGEIVRLTEHVAAQVDSRLAGAGILLMPSEMTFPSPPDQDGKTRVANNAEDLMAIIQKAMAASIENRDDASAIVPIVITAPADAIQAVKHLTFWSELDAHAIELRNEAIRRLALGMDMPPEVLQGISESNHWSAWQADESAIKSHTEPLLKIITSSLAQGYLRPILEDDPSFDDEIIEHYSIKADTSEMRLRPNRSKEALELYNLGVLSEKALRRETGFDEDDALTGEERTLWYLRKVAGGSTTPELVAAALKQLGLDLPVTAPEAETQEGRPAPSLKDHPAHELPDPEVGQRRKEARERGDVPSSTTERRYALGVGLTAACDQIVVRALERAGNRMKNRMRGAKPTFAAVDIYQHFTVESPEELEFLLDDAWSHVPRTAEQFGVDPAWLTSTLHTYTESLISGRVPHSYDSFSEELNRSLDAQFGVAA